MTNMKGMKDTKGMEMGPRPPSAGEVLVGEPMERSRQEEQKPKKDQPKGHSHH